MANMIGSATSAASERVEAERRDQRQDQKRGEDDEVAMGQIDQPHDAEDQRQAGGEQRVEAAEQHALDDGVEPALMRAHARNRRRGSASRDELGRRARQRDAAFLEAVDAVGDPQRLADVLLDDDDGCALPP